MWHFPATFCHEITRLRRVRWRSSRNHLGRNDARQDGDARSLALAGPKSETIDRVQRATLHVQPVQRPPRRTVVGVFPTRLARRHQSWLHVCKKPWINSLGMSGGVHFGKYEHLQKSGLMVTASASVSHRHGIPSSRASSWQSIRANINKELIPSEE